MSPDSFNNSIFLARQPIFDNDLNLFAYELLFRNNQKNESGVDDINGDKATSQVISHTFLEFGIDRVLGNKPGFINLTRAFLTGELPLPFKTKNIVLEILEEIEVDEDIIKAVKKLSGRGFTIALDDFIYHEDLKALVDVANIIKIDLLALSEQELIEHDNKATALQIISELQTPNISITEIENLVKQDISLSYKLLRCLNSAAFALPKHVNSLKQAVIYLGLDTIRAWATIIAFSNVDSPVSNALLNTALVRAKMAEILAEYFNCDPEAAFILGLFSPADTLFNKPMEELLSDLPISENLKLALQNSEGPLGNLLMFVRTHERGSLTIIPNSLSIPHINRAYITATDWANTSFEIIN